MSDLRLVVPALSMWVSLLAAIWLPATWRLPVVAFVLMLLCVLGACRASWRGQLAVSSTLSAVGVLHIGMIQQQLAQSAANYDVLATPLAAQVTSRMSATGEGWFVRLQPQGMPVEIPCFVQGSAGISGEAGTVPGARAAGDAAEQIVPGAEVLVEVTLRETSGFPGYSLQAQNLELHAPPSGLAAFAQHVQQEFREVVATVLPSPQQGLLPAMVLGDTSLQNPTEKQWYIDTGLAHLSAVSGGNLTIIIAMVVAVVTWRGGSPRLQGGLAIAAIALFIVVVGTEPSVYRAGMMGMVSLVALLGYRRTQCIQVLCVSIIVLLLWQPQLAVSFGFALSVAATAGIVVGYPMLYRALALRCMPDILARGIAIAIAADLATLPLVAAMAGHIPLLGVLANVLAAPMVAPITVLGLLAVLLLPLPYVSEILVWCLQPAAWWIATVARTIAQHPYATYATGNSVRALVAVLLLVGWMLWLWRHYSARVLVAVATLCSVTLLAGWVSNWSVRWTAVHTLPQLQVASTKQIPEAVPPEVVIVVTESGSPHERPVRHPQGNVVWYPNRDGEVEVNQYGHQRAVDGHF